MAPYKTPLIQLIGEQDENIYQLGLSDRDRHKALFQQIKHFLTTGVPALDKTSQMISARSVQKVLEENPEYKKILSSYAQGLNLKLEELTYALMIPELVSCMSAWAPGVPSTLLGCSSFFALEEDSQKPMHARVLDFPLAGVYDKEERVLRTHFPGKAQVASVGTAGFPFGSITGMNSLGLTLALHQKFTGIQEMGGTPIFQLAQEVLETCSTPEDVLSLVKKHKSITTWALIMSFSKTNQVMELDLMGEKPVYKTYKLEPGKVLYFCNKVLDESFSQENYAPYGIVEYNRLRELNAFEKIKKFEKKANFSLESFLQLASTPLREHHDKIYKKIKECEIFDTLTPSSLAINILSPSNQEILGISSPAPKAFRGEIYRASQLFQNKKATLTQEKIKGKKVSKSYHQGLQHLIFAQTAYDRHDVHNAYHHIQMAELEFKYGPLNDYTRFFKLVFDFIHMDHESLRAQQLREMLALRDQLPLHLKDLMTLMIIRTQRIIKAPLNYTFEDIQHPMLKKTAKLEQKIPTIGLKKTVWKLMNPRIDIADVLNHGIKA